MPNWCCQNWVLRGPRKEIKRFCDTVNSCLTRPDVQPNGFGKFWLGNLTAAFGENYNDLDKSGAHLRGVLSAYGDECACFFGPPENDTPLSFNDLDGGQAEVRFSVTTAWGPSKWFEKAVEEKFPDLHFGWKATDEFGNFHTCRNLDLLGEDTYIIEQVGEDSVGFGCGEEEKVAKVLSEILGTEVSAKEILTNAISMYEKICDFNEVNEDHEVYFTVWVETAA